MEAVELRPACSHTGGVVGSTESVVVAKQVSVAANPPSEGAEVYLQRGSRTTLPPKQRPHSPVLDDLADPATLSAATASSLGY